MHSIWALVTGGVVIWLAHERYGLVPWVVGFLALTWLSTWFFSRRVESGAAERGETMPSFGHGFVSYATRILYQETLFFLIPFYAYSTVFPSWNVVFILVLAVLATLACLDLVFDRWLRVSPVFGMIFFTTVAFGAANLLLPVLFGLDLRIATPVAGAIAVATGLPLAWRASAGLLAYAKLALTGVIILGVSVWLQAIVPPAPLRLQRPAFGADFDTAAFQVVRPFEREVSAATLDGKLVVLANVFAPSALSTRVVVEWWRDGKFVRASRELEITAHAGGFRVWDAYRPGALSPGRYRVRLRTADGRLFGTAAVDLR